MIEEASREDSGPSHSHFPQSGVFPAAALAAVEQQHALSEFLMGTRSGSIIKPSLLRTNSYVVYYAATDNWNRKS